MSNLCDCEEDYSGPPELHMDSDSDKDYDPSSSSSSSSNEEDLEREDLDSNESQSESRPSRERTRGTSTRGGRGGNERGRGGQSAASTQRDARRQIDALWSTNGVSSEPTVPTFTGLYFIASSSLSTNEIWQ